MALAILTLHDLLLTYNVKETKLIVRCMQKKVYALKYAYSKQCEEIVELQQSNEFNQYHIKITIIVYNIICIVFFFKLEHTPLIHTLDASLSCCDTGHIA